jgi:hypothetical protein
VHLAAQRRQRSWVWKPDDEGTPEVAGGMNTRRPFIVNTKFLAALGVALALAVSACGSDSGNGNNNSVPVGGSTPMVTTPMPTTPMSATGASGG